MKELITVKQLPVIEENLKNLSEEITKKVTNALSLVCNEETVKQVKDVRAELTKEYKELETQRKEVKSKILAPYEALENIYKQYVGNIFTNADLELKNKIDEFIEKVEKDLELIGTQEYQEEILLEYDKDLDISRAILEVQKRHKALENMQKEKSVEEVFEQPAETKIEEHTEKLTTVQFTITDTETRIIELRTHLDKHNYKYE